jgi:nucleotide-binding universal stress UspA family protein
MNKMVRKILVPLDGSQLAEQVLPRLQAIVECRSADIHLLSVAPVIDNAAAERQRIETELLNYLQGVARDLEPLGANVCCIVRFGSPAEEVLSYASQNNIELIAMCTHGRSGLARWAYGSVADRVLREARCPVLLVRAK